MFYYLGIDIAGYRNTWVIAIGLRKERLYLERLLSLRNPLKPKSISLKEVLQFCIDNRVLGIGIDSPLSFSIENENGIRTSDRYLKKLLPKEAKNWVVSYNTLMAVPLRASILAKHLSPYCGTIIETHPRASFYFILPENKKPLAFIYKKVNLKNEKRFLINWLKETFDLCIPFEIKLTEGILDAILCGLAGYLYHRYPERLIFLPGEKDLKGFGPFVIIGF